MTEKKLIDGDLISILINQGILQELNRTMFHPLGLEMRINTNVFERESQVEIWQTDKPEGYVFDRINPMFTQVFRNFSLAKHKARMKTLGFGIQIKDLYRSENIHEVMMVPPSQLKLELIMELFTKFANEVYAKLVSKHKDKDNNFNLEDHSEMHLKTMFQINLNEEDWIDVAALAMMLHYLDDLHEGLIELEQKAKEYNQRKENYEKEVFNKEDSE